MKIWAAVNLNFSTTTVEIWEKSKDVFPQNKSYPCIVFKFFDDEETKNVLLRWKKKLQMQVIALLHTASCNFVNYIFFMISIKRLKGL